MARDDDIERFGAESLFISRETARSTKSLWAFVRITGLTLVKSIMVAVFAKRF
jgi:hypothetical protein